MQKQQLINLVNKYLEGNCSPDEELLLERYLEYVNKGKTDWNEKELGDKKIVEEKVYSKITNIIALKENNSRPKIIASPYLLKIAASIIFLIAALTSVLYISGVFNNNSKVDIWKERVTVPGERLVIKLADSSEIVLNAGSRLKYPAVFPGNTREVYLEGEAYFEVKHDITKPFIVHTTNISTTVLGTKFNVCAFTDDKNISVSLVEGSVKVTEIRPNAGDKYSILRPNDKLVYNFKSKSSKIEKFDLLEAIGWKDNILKFKDEPLKNVFLKLERAYGIKFKLESKSFENYLITTNFQKAPVETVSQILKKLTGLDYRTIKENNQVKEIVFFKR
ncbi:MAG: FecR domain-containing protein [Ignavibacteriaceae bacterium]|nr:FecR domain-containing protein [Ignavibacteriaceae bacterium]